MSQLTQTLQVISISTALLASGGIATLSLFDVPLLQSQPASRSLPLTRWLFSRGSHIFPSAAFLSCAGFSYLAYDALPQGSSRSVGTILSSAAKGGKVGLYVGAAVACISIAPFTTLVMLPTNFTLIKRNEEKGGSRSEDSARARGQVASQSVRTAEESVDGKNDVSQLRDLSGPQSKTQEGTSEAEDREASELLGKFGRLNAVRALLMGVGGVLGLVGALSV